MMCLGWKPQKACVEITKPLSCPDVSWFWMGLAVVGLGLVVGGGRNRGEGGG